MDVKTHANSERLLNIIHGIHIDCFHICKMALGKYIPVAGNIGVFCQSEDDFAKFSLIQKQITIPSVNPDQKYFQLKETIIIPTFEDIPETSYTWLYIRKVDPTPYGKYLGDIDFIMGASEYIQLKNSASMGETSGAEIYNRPGWDTIQITSPNIKAVAYISTKEFAEKVRVKFD